MRKQLVVTVLAGLSLAPSLSGQGWAPPRPPCDLKPGHFLVNSGLLYLKNAAEVKFPEVQERDLKDAYRTLLQALNTAGQDKNPAAWYYLGRYYVVRGDVPGADSAFSKAETLAPACKTDIQSYRRNALWFPALKAGADALNAQHYDTAMVLLRQAVMVYDGEPQGFTTLAAAYFNLPPGSFFPESTFRKANPGLADSVATAKYDSLTNTRYDSAAKYFRLGVRAASDPKFDKEKKDAMFNLANSFYAAQRYDSAAASYADYLRVVPNDAQARARLADVLSAGGHKDSAMAMYAQIIQHADSAEPSSLFSAGVSIYNAAPPVPDTVKISAVCRRAHGSTGLTVVQRRSLAGRCSAEAADSLRQRDAAAVGNYRMAAQAFEAALARAPQNRDGLFNLTSSYFALRDSVKMLATAQRLFAVDPMNRSSIRLLAQAWQLRKQSDSALYYVTLSDSLLPVEVSVGGFGPGDQSASISGLVTNFHARPSAPLKIVFEFLNGSGAVVATQTADIPAIDPGGNRAFQLQAQGAGIVGWRYKKG
jgi:tetratricopeptide (TPR) repeat protein